MQWSFHARDTLAQFTARNVGLNVDGSVHDPTDPVRLLVNVLDRKIRRRARRAANPAWLRVGRRSQELVCLGFGPDRPLTNQRMAGGWLRAV